MKSTAFNNELNVPIPRKKRPESFSQVSIFIGSHSSHFNSQIWGDLPDKPKSNNFIMEIRKLIYDGKLVIDKWWDLAHNYLFT